MFPKTVAVADTVNVQPAAAGELNKLLSSFKLTDAMGLVSCCCLVTIVGSGRIIAKTNAKGDTGQCFRAGHQDVALADVFSN